MEKGHEIEALFPTNSEDPSGLSFTSLWNGTNDLPSFPALGFLISRIQSTDEREVLVNNVTTRTHMCVHGGLRTARQAGIPASIPRGPRDRAPGVSHHRFLCNCLLPFNHTAGLPGLVLIKQSSVGISMAS